MTYASWLNCGQSHAFLIHHPAQWRTRCSQPPGRLPTWGSSARPGCMELLCPNSVCRSQPARPKRARARSSSATPSNGSRSEAATVHGGWQQVRPPPQDKEDSLPRKIKQPLIECTLHLSIPGSSSAEAFRNRLAGETVFYFFRFCFLFTLTLEASNRFPAAPPSPSSLGAR